MKRDKIIYWVTTGLVAASGLMSGVMYLTKNPQVVDGFKLLGYPYYFAVILGIAKLLGAVALVLPLWERIKEWAYAGFTFVFLGATLTHIATSTPWVAPFISLLVLLASYLFWKRAYAVVAK